MTLVERLRLGVADTGVLIKTAAEINATLAEAVDRIEQLERAIDDQMVITHLGVFEAKDDPAVAIHKLMCWSQDVGAFFAKDRIAELESQIVKMDTDKCNSCAGYHVGEMDTRASQLEDVLRVSRDAFQTYSDEHEECTDADGWTAMMCSIEAHHVADEVIAKLNEILGSE